MSTFPYPTALTLGQRANRRNAETPCIPIAPPKSSLCFQAGGASFGGVGARLAKSRSTLGDIINIPTGMFRGFENIGTDYGMIMAILGGDDAGGGVIWAPQVIEDARDHGLILAETGRLYDSHKGEQLPDGVAPMSLLTEQQLKLFPEPTTAEVVPNAVARYLDLMAFSDRAPAKVIGADALLVDRPGFEVDFLSRPSAQTQAAASDKDTVLMPATGHWRVSWADGSVTLNPGDTASIPAGTAYTLEPAMTGEAGIYRVVATDDPAGPTWRP